jgi:hypothetical protein
MNFLTRTHVRGCLLARGIRTPGVAALSAALLLPLGVGVSVSINNRAPKLYGAVEFARFPHTTIKVEGQNGDRVFAGVALCDLLAAAGVELGGEQRPAALTTYIWVESADGYKVLFSGAEINRFIGAGEVLLADSEDGEAVAKTAGPYRLVVVADKVHARWLRQVKAVHVVQAAPPPPPK